MDSDFDQWQKAVEDQDVGEQNSRQVSGRRTLEQSQVAAQVGLYPWQWQPPASPVQYNIAPPQINYSYTIQNPIPSRQSTTQPSSSQTQGNDIVEPIKISKSINIMIVRMVVWTILTIILLFVYQFATDLVSMALSEFLQVYWRSKATMYIVIILLFLVGVVILFFRWSSTCYLVYPSKIVVRKGVLKKDDKDIFLDDILAVELIQDDIAKLLKYGTLELKYLPLTGTEKSDMVENIGQPKHYQDMLRLLIRRSKGEK